MRVELTAGLVEDSPTVDGADLDDLLALFEVATSAHSVAILRRRLAQQVLRALEISLLSDGALIDIALNPGLYLGQETNILTERLTELLGSAPPFPVIRHFRMLLLSRSAGAGRKASLGSFDNEVLRRHRLRNERLRCSDCGYHFIEADLGQARLQVAHDLGYIFANEKLARRLRDPWKPSAASNLTVDHIIPEAAFGPTDPDNLRIVCRFCNEEKKIYRWAGEAMPRDVAAALLSLGEPSRGLWAARATTYVAIIESGGKCLKCDQSVDKTELTAHPALRRGTSGTAPWDMRAVCYECYDPAV